MNTPIKDPRPDNDLTNQGKNILPEPWNMQENEIAEATEFLDEALRMTEQPFENPE